VSIVILGLLALLVAALDAWQRAKQRAGWAEARSDRFQAEADRMNAAFLEAIRQRDELRAEISARDKADDEYRALQDRISNLRGSRT
jgi:uncharacterized coiled-coil DUF342 family protein